MKMAIMASMASASSSIMAWRNNNGGVIMSMASMAWLIISHQ
jgi:hypothetical protein